jgi:hypothetical protein
MMLLNSGEAALNTLFTVAISKDKDITGNELRSLYLTYVQKIFNNSIGII